MKFKAALPLLEDLRNYDKDRLKGDLTAGMTVGVMLIPQGMAIAVIAGLPPLFGLYAATLPLIVYAFLGTSRQMAVGPVALVAFLVFSGVSLVAVPESPEYIGKTWVLALMVGAILCGMGLFKLGFLVNFLSAPVISGFTSGLAVIVILVQSEVLLGLPNSQLSDPLALILAHVTRLDQIHVITALIGLSSILFLVGMKRIKRSFPSGLVAMVVVMGITFYWSLEAHGVVVLGEVPSGLPSLKVPSLSIDLISNLFPLALTIAVVAFVGSISMAKAVWKPHHGARINPNQELVALGLANIFGGFFQSMPVAGGLSRTAVNSEAGSTSGVSGLVSAGIVAMALIFLTPAFYYLPKMVLAAIIIVAASGLINIEAAKNLWRTDRLDFSMLMATFFGTIFLGVQEGIFIGVSLSIGMVVYKTSRPHMAVLGRVKGTNIYKNIERFGTAEIEEEILVFRFDARLYFANVSALQDKLDHLLMGRKDAIKLFILDAQSISDVDSTGVKTLIDILAFCKEHGICFTMVSVIGPVRDKLYRSGFVTALGSEHFHERAHEAVQWYETAHDKTKDYIQFQTNLQKE